MRILLTAINAKYIHSNLAVYSLKASAGKYEPLVELAEFTINHQSDYMFGEIFRRRPQILFFSCYIWNRKEVLEAAENIRKVLPDTVIWAGGPEVSWDAEAFLRENPQFDGVMVGEGEKTFYRLLQHYVDDIGSLEDIPGIVWKEIADRGRTDCAGCCEPVERTLDHLPFVYEDLQQFENRIIYYESSRGCPFSCSYCLSSLEKSVRFRSLPLVKRELSFFLEHRVPQVKFVDRTFNCSHERTLEIWRFLLEHDNGVTNFHFELSADLLNEEEIEVLSRMRPGLVQLEIGVQTVNREALRAIHRNADFEKIAANVRRIAKSHNVHQHLDLIAGLPFEDFESFGRSFDAVYRLHPQELQLGFLKVLRGSKMHRRAEEYGILYRSAPPYEVLETKWISCGELLRLKDIEEMLEVYYNSRQFDCTIEALEHEYGRPFLLYEALADFYREKDGSIGNRSYTRMQRMERLREFARRTQDTDGAVRSEKYDKLLIQDLYLRENAKTRPDWAEDQGPWKRQMIAFYQEEEKNGVYLPDYRGYTWKQIMKMTHLERMEGNRWLLFDYAKRDPLTYAARVQEIIIS